VAYLTSCWVSQYAVLMVVCQTWPRENR